MGSIDVQQLTLIREQGPRRGLASSAVAMIGQTCRRAGSRLPRAHATRSADLPLPVSVR